MTAHSGGPNEPCHKLFVFGWVDLNRSNSHNRAGSVRKLFKATRDRHIDHLFRSRVLAALVPASNNANRHRLRCLVGVEYGPCHGCCLGLNQAGAGSSSAFRNDLDSGRRRRD